MNMYVVCLRGRRQTLALSPKGFVRTKQWALPAHTAPHKVEDGGIRTNPAQSTALCAQRFFLSIQHINTFVFLSHVSTCLNLVTAACNLRNPAQPGPARPKHGPSPAQARFLGTWKSGELEI